jgi:hypothetical protein
MHPSLRVFFHDFLSEEVLLWTWSITERYSIDTSTVKCIAVKGEGTVNRFSFKKFEIPSVPHIVTLP